MWFVAIIFVYVPYKYMYMDGYATYLALNP